MRPFATFRDFYFLISGNGKWQVLAHANRHKSAGVPRRHSLPSFFGAKRQLSSLFPRRRFKRRAPHNTRAPHGDPSRRREARARVALALRAARPRRTRCANQRDPDETRSSPASLTLQIDHHPTKGRLRSDRRRTGRRSVRQEQRGVLGPRRAAAGEREQVMETHGRPGGRVGHRQGTRRDHVQARVPRAPPLPHASRGQARQDGGVQQVPRAREQAQPRDAERPRAPAQAVLRGQVRRRGHLRARRNHRGRGRIRRPKGQSVVGAQGGAAVQVRGMRRSARVGVRG